MILGILDGNNTGTFEGRKQPISHLFGSHLFSRVFTKWQRADHPRSRNSAGMGNVLAALDLQVEWESNCVIPVACEAFLGG